MHRAELITYYDELGVAPNASQAEIRDAFRALVRLLHPDHQSDDQLKATAGAQMRKINRIYAVLSDPEKRRKYDDFLEEDPSPTIVFNPASNINVHRLAPRAVWVLAVLATCGALAWLGSEGIGSQPQAIERSPARTQPSAEEQGAGRGSLRELDRLRSGLRVAMAERDAAIRELQRLRTLPAVQTEAGSSAPQTRAPHPSLNSEPPFSAGTVLARPGLAGANMPLPVSTMTELPSIVQPPASSPPPSGPVQSARSQSARTPASASRPFTGFWFYSRVTGSGDKSSHLYPPEFIETTIVEKNGQIYGKYRSRYRIVDRAISPDVTFEFAGTPNGNTLVCPWWGLGGARGELTLKIAGDNALTVDWVARQLGSAQSLASGTATLIRQIE